MVLVLRRNSLANEFDDLDADPFEGLDEVPQGSSNFTVLPPAPKEVPPEERVDRAGAWPYWGTAEQLAQGFTWGRAKRGAARMLAKTGRFENEDDAYNALSKAEAAYQKENPFSAPLETFGASALAGGPALKLGAEAVGAAPFLPAIVKRFLLGTTGYDRAGGALPGVGAFAGRTASQATAGALQGGALTAGQAPLYQQDGESYDDYIRRGIETGAIFGPISQSANAFANWIKGPVINADRARLGQSFQRNGIPLRGRQVENAAPFTPEQDETFTRAVARSFGEDLGADEGLSPDVAERFIKRNKADFQAGAAGGGVNYNPKLHSTLAKLEADAGDPTFRGAGQPLIDEIQNLRSDFGIRVNPITGRTVVPTSANLTGQDYLRLTQRGSKLDQIARETAHGDIRDMAGKVREALDDALEASNPDQAELIQNARREYKNFRTIEPLFDSGGQGSVKPSRVLARVRAANRDFVATGTPNSDLGDLARGANAFFTRPDNGASGLPSTIVQATKKLAKDALVGLVSGGATSIVASHPAGATTGAVVAGSLAAGQAAKAGVDAYRNSQAYANRLIDRGLLARMAPNLSQSEFNRLIGLLVPGVAARNGAE